MKRYERLKKQLEILGTIDLNNAYHGTVIDHIVGQELLARQYSALHGLAFWVRQKSASTAEVAYKFNYKGKLVPVEVNSRGSGKLRSLGMFMDMAPHDIAVRFYAGEFLISTITTPGGKTVHLLNLPYYLVSQIEKYLDWFEPPITK